MTIPSQSSILIPEKYFNHIIGFRQQYSFDLIRLAENNCYKFDVYTTEINKYFKKYLKNNINYPGVYMTIEGRIGTKNVTIYTSHDRVFTISIKMNSHRDKSTIITTIERKRFHTRQLKYYIDDFKYFEKIEFPQLFFQSSYQNKEQFALQINSLYCGKELNITQ